MTDRAPLYLDHTTGAFRELSAGAGDTINEALTGALAPSIRQASRGGCYFSAFQTNLATEVMSSQVMWVWTLGGPLQFEFGGFYTDSGGDHNSGATTTVTAGLEYPIGVTSVGATFGGSGSGSYASGARALCDPVGNLPYGWAKICVRTFQTNPNGVPLGGFSNSPSVPFGAVNFGTSGVADLTQSTTPVTAIGGTSITCTPYAVLAFTDCMSDFLEGDSRTLGAFDSPSDSSGDSGNIARLLGAAGRAYINGGIGGMSAVTEASALPTSPRLHFMQRCTSGYCGLGINDPGVGRSAAQVLADRATVTGILAANVQSGVVRGGTLEPLTTSSDSFVTLANQTVSANEAKRLSINAGIRAGIAGEIYVFDFDVAADPGATGKWPVGNYPGLDSGVANSLDGTHGQNNFSQKFIKPYIGSTPCASRP